MWLRLTLVKFQSGEMIQKSHEWPSEVYNMTLEYCRVEMFEFLYPKKLEIVKLE